MPSAESQQRSAQLRVRTKEFAIRVFRLVDALPKTIQGRAVPDQIIRSATSVAANYRAACRAQSRTEFIAKIGVVEQEAGEALLWLELIFETNLLPATKLKPLLQEADELVATMAASRNSAVGNWQSLEAL